MKTGKRMELVEQIGSAAAVVALLAALLWWLRRKGLAHFSAGRVPRRGARRLEVIERLALAPQHCLHMVRIEDRLVLIGQSPTGLSLLDSRLAGPPAGDGGAA